MADELITQVGVGVVGVVIILREVFSFMKSQKVGKANGDLPVPRKEFESHKQIAQTKDNCEALHEAISQRFEDMEKRDDDNRKFVSQQFNGVGDQLKEVKAMIGDLN
jgi:hypothetical protein